MVSRVSINAEREDPDFVARRVIIHAYLYYVLDAPLISDAVYDRMVTLVAKGWDELSPDRQWALGSAEQIRVTGHHIKFSSLAAGAALNYHKYAVGEMLEVPHDAWKERRDGTRFVTTSHKPVRVDNGRAVQQGHGTKPRDAARVRSNKR